MAARGWRSGTILLGLGRRVGAGFFSLVASGCGGGEAAAPSDPCGTLDLTRVDMATVKAYAEAAAALRAKVGSVDTQFYYACKAMNDALGLEAPRNTYDACGVLRARVQAALDAGVEVGISFDARCWTDIGVQATCESKCQLDACDATTACAGAACHDACRARAQASATCSTSNAVVFASGDPELEHAIETQLDTWVMLDALTATLEEPIFGLDDPMVEYMQAADVRGLDEEQCFVRAYGDLAVAIMSLDTCRDARLALPIRTAARPG